MDRLQTCLSLHGPSHYPLCLPGLRIGLMEEKSFQRLPKDSGLWQGRAGELCPAQLGAALSPGRAPQQRSSLVPGQPGSRGLQDTGELCPAHFQKVTNAQGCVSRRYMSMLLWGPWESVLGLHRDLGHFVPWISSYLGWGRWSCPSCVPSPCQSSAALWGTGQRGSAGQGLGLSRDPG